MSLLTLATITFDFTGITGPLGELATALVTAIGVVVAAGITVWAVVLAVPAVKRMFKRMTS